MKTLTTKALVVGLAILAIAAAGTPYFVTQTGIVLKHPVTGAVTGHWNGTNGNLNATSYALKNVSLAIADTNLENWFFAESGNTTTTGTANVGLGSGVLAGVTTGQGNVGIGWEALHLVTTGGWNTAIGQQVLYQTTASFNCGFGEQCLYSDTTGQANNAYGVTAMFSNVDGSYNSAFGWDALYSNVSGNWNVGFGQATLRSSLTSSNTAVGFQAGYGDGTTANEKSTSDVAMTFIGYEASRDPSIPAATPLTNGIAIGANARVHRSNAAVIGGTGDNAVNIYAGTNSVAVTPAFPTGSTNALGNAADQRVALCSRRIPAMSSATLVGTTGGRIYAVPFNSYAGGVVTNLSIYVSTGAAPGGVVRVGLYACSNQSHPKPTTLLVDGGELADTTSTTMLNFPVNVTLKPNTIYFYSAFSNVANPTVSAFTDNSFDNILGCSNNLPVAYIYVDATYGAMPSTWPIGAGVAAVSNGTSPFACYAQFASSP